MIGVQEESWSHVQETINMLYLAVCQIEATMTDSNNSVNVLTNSFTQLAHQTQHVCTHLQNLNEPDQLELFKHDLHNAALQIQVDINASVEAFQFYDRVCQRLDHVSKSLEKVSTVVSDDIQRQSKDSWVKIQEEIKNSYSMEAERIMFEFIMRGGKVQQALEVYRHHFDATPGTSDEDGDEVELF